jgi:hypothetical protein
VRPARSTKPFVRGAAKACGVLAVGALALVVVVDPYSGNASSALVSYAYAEDAAPVSQTLTIGSTATIAGAKDSVTYSYTAPVVVKADDSSDATSDAAGDSTSSVPVDVPTPGSAKAIAYSMVKARGWSTSEYQCLVDLWNRESGWNVTAANPSGAYGIPQALPGSKMSSAGPDWQSNARTQIAWGLGYISGRYGTPCSAWAHSNAYNWY